MNNKKFLISVIVVSVIVIIGSLGYLFFKGQTSTAATGFHPNTAQTVLIKESGLTGVYSPPPSSSSFVRADINGLIISINGLAINMKDCEVIRGAMKSQGDPPPLVKIPLTNTTNKKMEIRKNPKPGQFGVQVASRDEHGNPVDENAWAFLAELNLPPKENTWINVELISSTRTKGFALCIFYKK